MAAVWDSLARIRRWRANPVIGYGIAAAALLISIGLRFVIEPHVTAGLPFITFFPAIILTTFLGGLRPGIAVAVIAGLVAWYFFLPPEFSFELGEKELASLFVFWLIAGMDVTLVHLLNRALDHAHRLAGERAVLLDEIQHRVANHLQFLAALFQMQQRDADDPAVREALGEALRRVEIVGQIHRRLGNAQRERLDLALAVGDICRHLVDASNRKVKLEVAVEPVSEAPDRALYICLIIVELVGNSLKYAFPDRSGTIKVKLETAGPELVVAVQDDGIGLPLAAASSKGGFGMRIVQQLAEQLGGTITITSDAGTVCRLIVPRA
jgi:two-component sensor histidine kinase